MREAFRRFAHRVSLVVGSAWAFVVALVVILTWALTGPIFNYSDTWQLVINTATTVVTFLMVFIIQNTQNRDAQAIHLKLDELIRAGANTRTRLVDLEELTDEELEELQKEFQALHAQYEVRAKNVGTEVGRRTARRGTPGSERESAGTE